MSPITRTLAAAAVAALFPTVAFAQQPVAKDSSAPKAEAAPAAEAAKQDTTKTVDEPLVLAGFYEMGAGRGITISLEDESLYGTPSNGEKRKLVHQYGTTYAVEGTQMTVRFTLDANGLPTEMVMRQNGQQRVLKKSN